MVLCRNSTLLQLKMVQKYRTEVHKKKNIGRILRSRVENDKSVTGAQFGPPDKYEHFSSHVEESDDFQPLTKKKKTNKRP